MPPSKHKYSGFMLVVEKKSNETGLVVSVCNIIVACRYFVSKVFLEANL